MIRAMNDLDKETRDGLWNFIGILFKSNLRMTLEGIQEGLQEESRKLLRDRRETRE